MNRRSLLSGGLASLIAAPAVVRAAIPDGAIPYMMIPEITEIELGGCYLTVSAITRGAVKMMTGDAEFPGTLQIKDGSGLRIGDVVHIRL